MDGKLFQTVEQEELRGYQKWGDVDKSPTMLLNAATEELGEVAHAINHNEGVEVIAQEIAETVGVLSRLYDMVMARPLEIDRWDVEVWAARSRKGEVCGIFGCPNKPVVKCKHCFNMYCEEHKFVLETPAHQESKHSK